jgi:hypothetical protein
MSRPAEQIHRFAANGHHGETAENRVTARAHLFRLLVLRRSCNRCADGEITFLRGIIMLRHEEHVHAMWFEETSAVNKGSQRRNTENH